MRLVSFEADGDPRAALLREDASTTSGATRSRGAAPTTARSRRSSRAACSTRSSRPSGDEGVPVEGVELLPPLTRPGKIICIGLNYRSHARGAGRRAARDAHLLRQVRERARGARRDGAAAALEREGGLRGRGGLRDRGPLQGRARRSGAHGPRGRLHAAERPLGARLPVQDAAVDAGQGVRRRRAVRPRARDARTRPARTTRSRSS